MYSLREIICKSLVGGFYRQWSTDGVRLVPNQVEKIVEFCSQINRAVSSKCKMITDFECTQSKRDLCTDVLI